MDEFERGLHRALQKHHTKVQETRNTSPEEILKRFTKPKKQTVEVTPGFTVILAVRERNSICDIRFEYETKSISRLQARFEAEHAAKEAGYPIIGFVVNITQKAN